MSAKCVLSFVPFQPSHLAKFRAQKSRLILRIRPAVLVSLYGGSCGIRTYDQLVMLDAIRITFPHRSGYLTGSLGSVFFQLKTCTGWINCSEFNHPLLGFLIPHGLLHSILLEEMAEMIELTSGLELGRGRYNPTIRGYTSVSSEYIRVLIEAAAIRAF